MPEKNKNLDQNSYAKPVWDIDKDAFSFNLSIKRKNFNVWNKKHWLTFLEQVQHNNQSKDRPAEVF